MKVNSAIAWLACAISFWPTGISAAESSAIVKDGRINVRGKPTLVGEVVTQLQKGEKVVVLEEITIANPKTNEPPRWFRIQMPPNTPVWVYAPYIDPAGKTVKVSKVNLRAGPGENFSVIGRLDRGAAVSEIRRVEDWMEIETPPGVYGFVAAGLLTKPDGTIPQAPTLAAKPVPKVVMPDTPKTSAPSTVPSASAPQTPHATAMVSSPAPQLSASATPKAEAQPAHATETVVVKPEPALALPAATPPAATPPAHTPGPSMPAADAGITVIKQPEASLQRRVVRREGLVRSTVSIQAPTYYELLSPGNRKTINYLHAENLEVNLKDYRGRRIIVTGEEAIDPRWPKTPLIEVESLELIP